LNTNSFKLTHRPPLYTTTKKVLLFALSLRGGHQFGSGSNPIIDQTDGWNVKAHFEPHKSSVQSVYGFAVWIGFGPIQAVWSNNVADFKFLPKNSHRYLFCLIYLSKLFFFFFFWASNLVHIVGPLI
jgi:hypothetical protein